MNNNSQILGIEGEKIAQKHLIKQGYKILETNWRFKKLEIDIICCKELVIVFVEVKARSSSIFGEPEVFVTPKKQRFLISAANQYLLENNIELESRFDVIAVVWHNNKSLLNQIEGAFYPTVL